MIFIFDTMLAIKVRGHKLVFTVTFWLEIISDEINLFWRRNYFFLILAHPVYKNVNNTGSKQVRIMKQTAF